MRMTLFLFLAILSFSQLKADERATSNLTANELAAVLDMHWWMVEIPSNLGPKDSVAISFVSSDGKEVAGAISISPGPGKIKLGTRVKVFCWEDKAARQMKVRLEVAGTVGGGYVHDYFDNAACGGPANGYVLHPGDVLLKFDSSKNPSLGSGNVLTPGQIGLEVVIKHA